MSLESGERLNGFFYEEVVTEDLYLKMELKKIGFNGESKFQVTARVVLGKLLRPGSTWNAAAGGPAPRSPCSGSCGSHRDLDDVAHTAGSKEHHYKAAPQQRGRLRTADPCLKIPHTLHIYFCIQSLLIHLAGLTRELVGSAFKLSRRVPLARRS